jgi:cellulose synthase operon protein C
MSFARVIFSVSLAAALASSSSFAEAQSGAPAAVVTEGSQGPADTESAAAPERAPAAPMSDATDAHRLEALSDLVRRYEEQSKEFREEVRVLADRKYKERRARIEDNYRKTLAPVVAAERRFRLDAIATFERFLERHPDNRKYTPDVMFRLAELYFEKYDDEHSRAMARFRGEYQKWMEAGGEGEPPPEPQQRFERTVSLYKSLISKFPEYRLLDGAYYLLGYTLQAQDENAEGLLAWRTLVDRYPNSRFFEEVWFRIGDYHFDEEEWEPAIAAFQKVTPLTESIYYDKSLYKLAWTYYLVNRFDDSVPRFFELLDFSYAKKANAPDGEGVGSVLEEEALQYVAISFADDNWPRAGRYKIVPEGESLDDPFVVPDIDYVRFAMDYFERVGAKPFERDVIARLGDILFKQSKNTQSVLALQRAIAIDPLHRDAPKLQDLIVQGFERERRFEDASRERDLLVANYGEGTAWSKAHINDSEARREATELARVSLYKAAIYYHTQASKYFEDGRQDLGVKAFEAASTAYRGYLGLYPHDKQAYELTFYLAETYYYSLHFVEAADTYDKVRDSTRGTLYRIDAGRNAVYALEKVIAAAVMAGQLDAKDPFQGQEASGPGEGEAVAAKVAEEMAPLRQRYIGAIDKFLDAAATDDVAPSFAYSAAALFFAHGQFEEAIRRFEDIVARYPNHEAARFAANLILDRLLADQDWTKAAEYAARFQRTMTSGDTALFAKIEGGAKFKIATQVLDEGAKDIEEGRIAEGIAKLEEGAESYLKLVAEDGQREFADLMVYNAAVSFERARRPARAAELYERVYKDFPSSNYAAQAMFNVAAKSEQAFDFDKAVATYLGLVKSYPDSERRADAQINAALALEGQQRYDSAADEFQRFATLFPERPEAPEVFFRSALVHKKREDQRAEEQSLREFIRRYRSNAEQVPRVVEAYARLGDLDRERAEATKTPSEKKRLTDLADASYKASLKEFERAKGSATASYFAAKAAFSLAERDFDAYTGVGILGKTGQQQGKELEEKSKRLQQVEQTYKTIITSYRQADWSLAALFRIGSLYDDLQQKIVRAPCPADIRRIDEIACDEYRVILEDQAYAVEEKAVEAYRTAYERAKDLKVSNEWTQRTLAALNRLRKAEFPIDKEPIEEPQRGETYGIGFLYPDGGAQEVQRLSIEGGS